MEALGAAASIAGIVSLAGQCWTGAKSLVSMYQEISSASKTVAKFIQDVNKLMRGISDVQDVLKRIEAAEGCNVPEINLVTLKLQLEDCETCIQGWISTARKYRTTDGSSLKKCFKNFWTALNQNDISNVSEELRRHRTEFSVALSVLGRAFDTQLAIKTADIQTGVDESKDVLVSLTERAKRTEEALERLEVLSGSIASMSVASMRSLDSLQSQLSSSDGPAAQPIKIWGRPLSTHSSGASSGGSIDERVMGGPRRITLEDDFQRLKRAVNASEDKLGYEPVTPSKKYDFSYPFKRCVRTTRTSAGMGYSNCPVKTWRHKSRYEDSTGS